jgi:hypothetical protein
MNLFKSVWAGVARPLPPDCHGHGQPPALQFLKMRLGAKQAFLHAKAGMAQVPAVDETIQKIGSTFRNHFVSKLSKPRTIGREAEFPVVNADGTSADVRKLLSRMDEDGDLKLKQLGDWGLYGEEYEYRFAQGAGGG